MTETEIIQILAGSLGTLGFGILFRIRKLRLLAAAAGGMIAWFLFLLLNKWNPNEPINYFLVSLLISFYNEIMARLLKTPTTVFATTCLVPLIPGGSLYYTMTYAFERKSVLFLDQGLRTLQLASALVLGIITASALTKVFRNLFTARKEKRNIPFGTDMPIPSDPILPSGSSHTDRPSPHGDTEHEITSH